MTKSIHDLEHALDVSLFDRSSRGVTLTTYGATLFARATEAETAFRRAEQLVPPMAVNQSTSTARFFRMDVSDRWLDAFIATSDHQNVAAAAASLNITPAAVSSSLRKLEDSLALTLFERTPGAIVATTFGRSLVRYIKLARSQLRHACNELLSVQGVQRGHVTIGTLPFMRTLIAPRAVIRLLREHPQLDVATMEGSYDDLVAALRCGDIDFMVGALRGANADDDLNEEPLLEDQLSIIVRCGHRLERKDRVTWDDLLRYEWVLPRHHTPTRGLFEQSLAEAGLAEPEHVIETSSLAMLRGLLLESDRITVLSRHQIHYEERNNMLTALGFDLPDTRRPLGITARAQGSLSPAATLMIAKVREVVAELSPE